MDDNDNTRGFFMVKVAETVTLAYPVMAEDANEAREKVQNLIEVGGVLPPLDNALATLHRDGIEVMDAVESDLAPCEQMCATSFTKGEATKLMGEVGKGAVYRKDPPTMAHAAKVVLRKSGSGKLTPSKRKRK